MKRNYFAILATAATLLSTSISAQAQWIDSNILADDPRAYCSDVVAANRQSNIVSREQENSNSSVSISQRERGGGGGVSIFGIGVNGQGHSNNRRENRNSAQSGSTYRHDFSTVTNVTAGRNCDAFVQGAAHVEATQIQADVNHHLIDSRERVNMREMETNSQSQLFQMMMQGF